MIDKRKEITIDDFIKKLTPEVPLKLKPPELLLGEDDYTSISKSFAIIAKYRTDDWAQIPSVQIQSDLIVLQASVVDLLSRHAVLISYADSIEEQLRIARSKILVTGKSLKKEYEEAGDVVKVTLTDIKEISITSTEDIWRELAEHKNAADFVKFIYFAIKDMVSYLEKVVARLHYLGER